MSSNMDQLSDAIDSTYLCAVIDWHTRCALGWAVSNTMDTSLCLLALERARTKAGCVTEIFNCRRYAPPFGQPLAGCLPSVGSDQGSQFDQRGVDRTAESMGRADEHGWATHQESHMKDNPVEQNSTRRGRDRR